jgi:predicted transcriptional regulator
MARIGDGDPVKRSDIADALGKTSMAISEYRKRLIDKAVITDLTYGYMGFTLPGFATYVIETSQ